MCVLEVMNGHVLQTLREQLKVPSSSSLHADINFLLPWEALGASHSKGELTSVGRLLFGSISKATHQLPCLSLKGLNVWS